MEVKIRFEFGDGAVGGVESFGGDVACSTAGGIEDEGKVGGVVEREVDGFVGGKVGEVDPVGGSDEDIGGFDVAVGDLVVGGEHRIVREVEGSRSCDGHHAWRLGVGMWSISSRWSLGMDGCCEYVNR